MKNAEKKNILAQTPPMGWNSWNTFGRNINEKVVRESADAMVALGLKDLGYNYLVIDDHWHGGRDSNGYLFEHPEKFPSGMKSLAKYVHEKGLKFGIYSCAGEKTCGGEPGSHRFEEKDAEVFAKWDVDFLKYDYCYAPDDLNAAIRRYTKMGKALKATGREILFSICEWGPRSPWLWGRKAGGQMWRVSFDVFDMWDVPLNTKTPVGILTAIDAMANLANYAGPGGWNDPDMLVIGLGNTGYIKGGGCNFDEERTHMSMWCIMAAPLMIGCDIRNMSKQTSLILTNKEAIAINQDSLGKQGVRITRTGSTEIWKKPLADGSAAIAMLNRGETEAEITLSWKDADFNPGQAFKARDLWKHQETGTFKEKLSLRVSPHATELFTLSPV